MCLHTVELNLVQDNVNGVHGVGYKVIRRDDVQNVLNVWQRAKHNHGGKYDTIDSDDKNKYMAGFHIFLNRDDARNYINSPAYALVKVLFKQVTAFGTNETYTKNYLKRTFKSCVIAQSMKVTEVLD